MTALRASTTHECASACPREDMLYATRWSPWSIALAQRAAEAALPPIVGGWEGDDQVGEKGWAKHCDGLDAPVVMGKGAIAPWQPCEVAPVGSCGQPADRVHSPAVLAKGTKW